jgi:hypothetical protein
VSSISIRSFTPLHLNTLYPNLFLGCEVWSPNGARLACEGGFIDPTLQGVYTVRSSDGGDLQRITSDPFGDDCPSDYSPNGKRLVVTVGPLEVAEAEEVALGGVIRPQGRWGCLGLAHLFSTIRRCSDAIVASRAPSTEVEIAGEYALLHGTAPPRGV